MMRATDPYHDMHPSFGGNYYRDHLPLTQAEKNQLIREELFLQYMAQSEGGNYDYPEYYRGSHDELQERDPHPKYLQH